MIRLHRHPLMVAGEGHTSGHWVIAGYPLVVVRAAGRWRIRATYVTGASSATVLSYSAWLDAYDLTAAEFDRRRDALAALEVAITVASRTPIPPSLFA